MPVPRCIGVESPLRLAAKIELAAVLGAFGLIGAVVFGAFAVHPF